MESQYIYKIKKDTITFDLLNGIKDNVFDIMENEILKFSYDSVFNTINRISSIKNNLRVKYFLETYFGFPIDRNLLRGYLIKDYLDSLYMVLTCIPTKNNDNLVFVSEYNPLDINDGFENYI